MIVIGLVVVTTDGQRAARPRRRRLVRPAGGTPGPQAVAGRHRDRRARRRVRPARRRRPRRAPAGASDRATCPTCIVGSATAATASSGGRPGGRRRPVSANAGSCTARPSTCRRSAGSTSRPATVVVSNHPKCAAAIEQAHSDGNGLLAHHGSSYGNLFSGDAERAVLTMSGAGRRKEGRTGAGYFGYFSRPGQTIRTLLASIVEIGRERVAATPPTAAGRRAARRAGLDATRCCARSRRWSPATCRCKASMNDMCEGRAAIYVDMLGYDEVAHHSGPERVDTLAVLRDLDRQLGRIERTVPWTPRPYKIVVLSDHGQTQGATFEQRTGQTLAELVADLCGAAASGDTDAEAGRTESTAWLRQARHPDGSTEPVVVRRPDRARVGEPRADLDPRRAASSHPRGDRRPLPTADLRARRTSRDRLRAGSPGERLVDRARQPRQPAT